MDTDNEDNVSLPSTIRLGLRRNDYETPLNPRFLQTLYKQFNQLDLTTAVLNKQREEVVQELQKRIFNEQKPKKGKSVNTKHFRPYHLENLLAAQTRAHYDHLAYSRTIHPYPTNEQSHQIIHG